MIGINELMDAIKRSGLPFGDALKMRNLPDAALQEGLGGAIRGSNPITSQVPQLRTQYHQQLSKISEMDQKLASVYGDPSSKLYIEHAGARQRAMNPASDLGYKAAGDIQQQAVKEQRNVNQQENQQEQDINDAVKNYKQLAAIQVREEKRLKKLGKGKGSGGTIKLTKDQKLAGFKDSNAANYWQNIKESEFKKAWVQSILENPQDVPEGGWTIPQIQTVYDDYSNKKKTAKAQITVEKQVKKEQAKKNKTTNKKPLF